MSTILIIILLILIFGGGGGYYARGRYGNAGLGGVLGGRFGPPYSALAIRWDRHLRTASVTCGAAGGIRENALGRSQVARYASAAFLAGSKSSGNYSPTAPGRTSRCRRLLASPISRALRW